MGGDDAPARVVEGALLAVRELGLALELVGPVAELEPRLAREPDRARLSLTLVDAPEHVGMADRPRDALRKRATSIRVAVERVRTGEVSGLFSAGHTGATVVAAVAGLGLLPGVDRPALAVTIPTARGQAVLLDVGATVDCQPAHLRQFAAMGCAYAQVALGRTAPRVGLLSIGEEALKGDQLTREAFRALETSGLPFAGNVEACNLFDGDADVVVCDGFTGNIALKISEGVVDAVGAMLREELAASAVTRLGAALARPAFRRFARRVDASEFGGAPLLGVNGLCLVGPRPVVGAGRAQRHRARQPLRGRVAGAAARRRRRPADALPTRIASVMIAFIFPGQGSQTVGMGQAFAAAEPIVRDTFAEADAALGAPLSRLCFDGPETELTLTENTQPAILTVSVAIARVLEARGWRPDFYAGPQPRRVQRARRRRHVRLRRRGADGAQPRPLHAGGGAGRRRGDGRDPRPRRRRRRRGVRRGRATGEVVSPANLNAPGQVVIAGTTARPSSAPEPWRQGARAPSV